MTQDILAAQAFRIARDLVSQNVVWLCDDDQQAEALASAVAALDAGPVVFLPSSDALPGDSAPASPANSGQRLAALRQLRRHPVACILSGEAARDRREPNCSRTLAFNHGPDGAPAERKAQPDA